VSTRVPLVSDCRHGFTDSSGPPHLAHRNRRANASSVSPIEISVDCPKADHPAARAVGLDVRKAVCGELFERGVKWAHKKRKPGRSAEPSYVTFPQVFARSHGQRRLEGWQECGNNGSQNDFIGCVA